MTTGCGQLVEVSETVSGHLGGNTLEVTGQTHLPFNAIIRRADITIKAVSGGTGAGDTQYAAAITKGAHGHEDVGLETGGLEWTDNDAGIGIALGGGLIMTRVLWNDENNELERHWIKEMYHPVRKGTTINFNRIARGSPGDASDFNVDWKLLLEIACNKRSHPKGKNYANSYEFAIGRQTTGTRIHWVAPCDGYLGPWDVNYTVTGASEVEVKVMKGMDPLPATDGIDDNEIMPFGMQMSGELGNFNTLRNFHPGVYVRQGEIIHMEWSDAGLFNMYSTFTPRHGSHFKMHYPMTTHTVSTWILYEFPVTMRILQAQLALNINASAARQGYIHVKGPMMPPDYGPASGDFPAGHGIGVPGVAVDTAGVNPEGADSESIFIVPIDIPNGGHFNKDPAIMLNRIVREGDLWGHRTNVDSLEGDMTAVMLWNGQIQNIGKKQFVKLMTEGGSDLKDRSLDL